MLAVLSVHEIFSPRDLPPSWVTLAVLLGVIIVKEVLFRRVMALGEEVESTAVRTDAWHHRADAITSSAAFIGIAIARFGGPGWGARGFVGRAFCLRGDRLQRLPAPHPRPGGNHGHGARSGDRREGGAHAAAAVAGVDEVEKCRVRKMGLEFYVDLHVGVDGTISVASGHGIAHDVKNAVRQAEPRVADVLVHVEPANLCLYPRQH